MLSVSTQIAREDDLAMFARMLESVTFADEIIIYVMERDDAETRALCKKFGARVVSVKTPSVVEYIRGEQVKTAKYPWVLIMDFDEIIPRALKEEILQVTQRSEIPGIGGYYIQRHNFSLGYPLRHGGWGSDQVVRLLHRTSCITWPTEIHALPQVRGKLGHLRAPMEHHKDQSLAQMVAKTNRYGAVEAKQFFAGGLPPVTPLTLLRKPIMEFIRRYVLKLGFLDGTIGVIQSIYQGYSVFISYAKLYEKQHQHHHDHKKV